MDKEKPKCEKCGSGQIYIRIKQNKIVCRLCGHIQEIKNEKHKKED